MWSLTVAGSQVPILGIAALGTVVGYVAGMFGIGGGFLMTPLLIVIFGIPLPIAVGSGLCQIIGTSLVSFLRHRKAGQGEARFDLLMIPGSLLGVELGARTLAALANAGNLELGGGSMPWVSLVVETGYMVMLLVVAIQYWRHASQPSDSFQFLRSGPLARLRLGPRVDLPASGLTGVSALVIAYIGLGLGFLSGLLGIGGGVALNPVLLYGFGFPIRQAVGTGIVVLLATALLGTGVHAAAGHVHLGLSLVLLAGGGISAQFGALASKRMSGAALARVHALVIVLAIGAVAWDLVKHLV